MRVEVRVVGISAANNVCVGVPLFGRTVILFARERERARGQAERWRESAPGGESERGCVCVCERARNVFADAWWMVEMTVHPSWARSLRVLTIE